MSCYEGTLDDQGNAALKTNFGVEELRWENPVRPGDQLMLAITVLESRLSASRPLGIVRWRWDLTNQANKRVLHLTATGFFNLAASSQSLSES